MRRPRRVAAPFGHPLEEAEGRAVEGRCPAQGPARERGIRPSPIALKRQSPCPRDASCDRRARLRLRGAEELSRRDPRHRHEAVDPVEERTAHPAEVTLRLAGAAAAGFDRIVAVAAAALVQV